MSFTKALNKVVNDTIQNYVSVIVSKYNLDENELLELWNEFSEVRAEEKKPERKAPKTVANQQTNTQLEKLSRNELVELCKAKKLKVSGNKQELIDRLSVSEGGGVAEQKPEPEQKKSREKKPASSKPEKKIIEKIKSQVEQSNSMIRKNRFDNFEHPETTFVFDSKTKKVIGKQNANGQIDQLTDEDIESCKKFKFQYEIPDNLDSQKSFNVRVEELDDEEELQEDEEEVDEEELEEELEEEEEGEEYYDEM
jgi:hypothetical protein